MKRPTKTGTPAEPDVEVKKREKSSIEKIFGAEVMAHGFTGLPNVLVRAQGKLNISTTQFNIIVQLLSYWFDPKKPPFPSKRELADRMMINPATLRINIKKLEERGLILREQQTTAQGDWGSNIYRMDGLVKELQKLAPAFADEKAERTEAKLKAELPAAKFATRRAWSMAK